jgi:uncharacterized repeat protein (TIGR03809 family)
MPKYIPPHESKKFAHKWQALAERRRQHFIELYRSGRWRRYYSEQEFVSTMHDVVSGLEAWRAMTRDGQSQADEASPEATLVPSADRAA